MRNIRNNLINRHQTHYSRLEVYNTHISFTQPLVLDTTFMWLIKWYDYVINLSIYYSKRSLLLGD